MPSNTGNSNHAIAKAVNEGNAISFTAEAVRSGPTPVSLRLDPRLAPMHSNTIGKAARPINAVQSVSKGISFMWLKLKLMPKPIERIKGFLSSSRAIFRVRVLAPRPPCSKAVMMGIMVRLVSGMSAAVATAANAKPVSPNNGSAIAKAINVLCRDEPCNKDDIEAAVEPNTRLIRNIKLRQSR